MSTLEPLQYFASAVIVGLVLAVWGLWTWCMRLIKQRDRYEHEATYERMRAIVYQERVEQLVGRTNTEKYGEYRHRVLAEYGNRRADKK